MARIVGLFTTDEITNLTDGRAAGLLDTAQDHVGNKYVFAQGSGTIAAADVVAINSAGVAQAVTSALAKAAWAIGVAPIAVTSGSYAWFQTKGNCTINVLSTCSSGVGLYTSGTAGKLDDTTTSQVKIQGIATLADITAAASTAAVASQDLAVSL